MKLTDQAKAKYQLYIKEQLMDNQTIIISLIKEQGDTDEAQAFIEYMNERDFENAFELCTRIFNVHSNVRFMQNLLACFYPGVIRDWNKYNILVQTHTSDDFELFDKCLTNECKAFDRIYLHIYA